MTNKRPASCKLCDRRLVPGEAALWSHHDPCPPGYVCGPCYRICKAYRRQLERSSPSLVELRRWIADHASANLVTRIMLGKPMPMSEAAVCQGLLNATMQSMGLAGPFLAAPLLSYLTHIDKEVIDLEEFSAILNTVSTAVTNHLESIPNFPRLRTRTDERLHQTTNR